VVDDERGDKYEPPPERESAVRRSAADFVLGFQTLPPTGRHCQNSRMTAGLLSRMYVLLSAAAGITLVCRP
jgi:hypothetical protein